MSELHLSAQEGDWALVNKLLRMGANVNERRDVELDDTSVYEQVTALRLRAFESCAAPVRSRC